MTLYEAHYVLTHPEMYDDRTFHRALEIVKSAERQSS